MKWYEDLYLGDSIRHKHKKVKWKIIHDAGQPFVYVITLPANKENLLDIIPSWELMQKYYPKKNLKIVGIAGTYGEALEVVTEMLLEVYHITGGFRIEEYLSEKVNSKREK